MTTAGNRAREAVQQVLQGMWRQAGIEARIRNEPPRVFFAETLSKRNFQGAALFAWISAPESVPRSNLHSEEIPTEARNWSGQNYPGYRNPEMDALLEAIPQELDRDKRRVLWPGCRRSMRRTCRPCRSGSGPMRMSGRNGWRMCGRPGT